MKNKFIILDRDGVINIEKHYLCKIEDFEYEKGVVEALFVLKNLGYRFIIITNQAGIAKGYYTEEDYKKLEKHIENDLLQKNIIIEKTYFCPHHPDGIGKYRIQCECRKPNAKNFEKAIKEFNIDIKNSYMIGDRVTDLIPAEKLGFKTILLKTGYGSENIDKLKKINLKALVFENLLEFTRSI